MAKKKKPADLRSFETDEDGDMIDGDGLPIDCDGEYCEGVARRCVMVSVNGPHDDVRNYCEGCYEIYMVGVQHGRYHEAARHGARPGNDSSQDKPIAK